MDLLLLLVIIIIIIIIVINIFQPFCDGRHKTTTIQPVRFIAEETSSEVFLCGCKQTSSPPFCDGTHVSEQVQSAEISQ